MLVWPWGDITPVQDRIHIGRDAQYSAYAKDLGADLKVSRRHALVEPAAGGVLLKDLGSTNGTYVDDEPLHYSGARVLAEDAVIKFGTQLAVMLVFVPDEPAAGA
ncbi:MAG: FHA domain-containing protein [Burkholderiales bacterium]|nr:FHA domain-containing protein [Burkholderiales bacterium]